MSSIQEWENLNEQIASEMKVFSENYRCRKCPRQPRNAWCEHLLRNRTRKFTHRIKEIDLLLI